MIKSWLVGDMHAVDDVSIWALKSKILLSVSNEKKKKGSRELLLIFHNVYFIQKDILRSTSSKRKFQECKS